MTGAVEASPSEGSDKNRFCPRRPDLLDHRGEIGSHGLRGSDLLVVVTKLDGRIGLSALCDLRLDSFDYRMASATTVSSIFQTTSPEMSQ